MPLVKPLAEDATSEVAELAKFLHRTLGFTPNSILTMQRRPEVAKAFINLNKAVMQVDTGVDEQLKRMIGNIASLAAGCRYCQAHTALASKRFGVADEKIAALWEYQTSPLFSDAERAALDFAMAAASVPNAITDEIVMNLKEYWNEDQVVDILSVVALFGYLNRWNDSMGTTLEEGAVDAGETYLSEKGWELGKHGD